MDESPVSGCFIPALGVIGKWEEQIEK